MKGFYHLLPLPFLAACGQESGGAEPSDGDIRRDAMVAQQIERRGVRDARVLEAMRTVPRHLFVPPAQRHLSYRDYPLPIGSGQTISQPYIVAAMTAALETSPGDRILEIGTGCGYQAAVLAEVCDAVYTIEIIPELARRARETLESLDYTNVHVRAGDGFQGWTEHAPYDGIIVTCAPDEIPPPLLNQLADGGHLVIPVGGRGHQVLTRITRRGDEFEREELMGVMFVPMTGKARE